MDRDLQEAQARRDEANKTAAAILGNLNKDELEDFSVYIEKIKDDRREQAKTYSLSHHMGVAPEYKKVNEENYKDKNWWPKIQELFIEQEGSSVIPDMVFDGVEKYIYSIAHRDMTSAPYLP